MLFGKKVLGLDIGTSSVKMAEVATSRSGAKLVRLGYTALPPGVVGGGEIHDVAQLAEAIRMAHVEGGFKTKKVCTGLFGTSVITKKIAMPKMEKKLLREQIRWEAEQYLPFDISEVTLDYHVLQTPSTAGPDNIDVLLVGAKQEYVFRFIEAISLSGLTASIIDVSALALANCFQFNYGRISQAVSLLNVGSDVTNFVVMDQGEVVYCRDIPLGGSSFTSDIAKELGVSTQEAETLKLSAVHGEPVPDEVHNSLKGTCEILADEVSNSFDFYVSMASDQQSISKVYLSGGSMGVPGLGEQITKSTGVPLETHDAFQKVGLGSKSLTSEYIEQISSFLPVVMGLALRKEGDS